MLSLGRCRLDLKVRTLMMVDSLEMTGDDRRIIAEHCRGVPEDRDRNHPRHRYHGGDPPSFWRARRLARPSF